MAKTRKVSAKAKAKSRAKVKAKAKPKARAPRIQYLEWDDKPAKPIARKAKAKAVPKAKPKHTKSKPRKARPSRPTLREIERLRDEARAANEKRRSEATKLQAKLTRALELAQDMALEIGHPSDLAIEFPPMAKATRYRSPWVIVGHFAWEGNEVGYAELWSILDKWEGRRLEARIDKDRISRLRINYVTDRGKREEYTLAETGPWQLALRRAKDNCDPEDTETSYPGGRTGSLAARYPESQIESVTVWLSEAVGVNVMTMK